MTMKFCGLILILGLMALCFLMSLWFLIQPKPTIESVGTTTMVVKKHQDLSLKAAQICGDGLKVVSGFDDLSEERKGFARAYCMVGFYNGVKAGGE